jgi:primosomal protein N'
MPFLFIHPRKGLFQLTKCQSCGFVYGCNNCTGENNKPKPLTLFSRSSTKFFFGCNHCQTSYVFDQKCPKCSNIEFSTKFGGIEELQNILQDNFALEVSILEQDNSKSKSMDNQIKSNYSREQAFLTTRLFDPALDYSQFHTIIIIHSENLLIGTDYLVQEELHKNLVELFLATDSRTKIIFDTIDTNQEFFNDLRELSSNLKKFISEEEDSEDINVQNDEEYNLEIPLVRGVAVSDKQATGCSQNKINSPSNQNPPIKSEEIPQNSNIAILNWHQSITDKESKNRRIFGFPPFYNLILLTTQEKKREGSYNKIKIIKDLIESQVKGLNLSKIRIGSPYPAKFLQRKGMYSYHLLIKFPRQYEDYEQLKTIINNTAFSHRVQVRLNPQHIF